MQEYSPLKKELVQDVDFVIVRELTGGIYFGEREEAQGEGANEFAWDKETYSRYEVERIMGHLLWKQLANVTKRLYP